jgi:hypothetical protein
LPGRLRIDGVTWQTYEENLEENPIFLGRRPYVIALKETSCALRVVGQSEVGDTDCVIGVKMGEQQHVDPADRHAEFEYPHGRAATGVDQDGVIACLDKCAWTKTIETGDWHPRPD